jgi:hypothetical protein
MALDFYSGDRHLSQSLRSSSFKAHGRTATVHLLMALSLKVTKLTRKIALVTGASSGIRTLYN